MTLPWSGWGWGVWQWHRVWQWHGPALEDGRDPAQRGGLSPLLMPAQATSSTCLA